MGPVVDCTPLKIGRGVQPNFRQSEPKGEVPDLYGKRICSCPNCPPPLQGPGDRKLPESAGYTAGGDKGVACEEVREGESEAARGYDGPREWVLTAALGEAPCPATNNNNYQVPILFESSPSGPRGSELTGQSTTRRRIWLRYR